MLTGQHVGAEQMQRPNPVQVRLVYKETNHGGYPALKSFPKLGEAQHTQAQSEIRVAPIVLKEVEMTLSRILAR